MPIRAGQKVALDAYRQSMAVPLPKDLPDNREQKTEDGGAVSLIRPLSSVAHPLTKKGPRPLRSAAQARPPYGGIGGRGTLRDRLRPVAGIALSLENPPGFRRSARHAPRLARRSRPGRQTGREDQAQRPQRSKSERGRAKSEIGDALRANHKTERTRHPAHDRNDRQSTLENSLSTHPRDDLCRHPYSAETDATQVDAAQSIADRGKNPMRDSNATVSEKVSKTQKIVLTVAR